MTDNFFDFYQSNLLNRVSQSNFCAIVCLRVLETSTYYHNPTISRICDCGKKLSKKKKDEEGNHRKSADID